MEQSYVLPNRKAFADSIVRIFLKYKNKVVDPLDLADSEEDLCKRQGDMSRNSRELLEHQKIVKEDTELDNIYEPVDSVRYNEQTLHRFMDGHATYDSDTHFYVYRE